MSVRFNLAGPFRGLPSLEPEAGPSLEPEKTSSWESEEELPSLEPSDHGSLEGVGSPFRGLPSLAPGPLDVFSVSTIKVLPKNERIATIARRVLASVGMEYSAHITMLRREAAETARRHLLERIEQEIANLDSTSRELGLRRAALELQAHQLRSRPG
jgi:hypothetical protein